MSTPALGTCPRGHQDEEVPAVAGTPQMAVEVLREHLEWQADARLRAGVLWQDNGLVFTTAHGTQPTRRMRAGAPEHPPESGHRRAVDAA